MDKVDQYIDTFPVNTRAKLNSLRALIRELAPGAEEGFAYGMPAYKFRKKPLVYFAGFKNHVGLYALPSAHEAFADALKSYKKGKGSVQFPLEAELPIALIREMVLFNLEKIQSAVK